MGWIIVVIGAICSTCGGWLAYSGYEIIQVERGWAMVISGATLFSAGVIALSLGLLALKLTSLAKSLPRGAGGTLTPVEKPWTKATDTVVSNAAEPHVLQPPSHISDPVIAGAGAAVAVVAATLVEQTDLFSTSSKHEDTEGKTAQQNLKDDILPLGVGGATHTATPPELSDEATEHTPKQHIKWPDPVILQSVPTDEQPAVQEPAAPSLAWLTAALKHPPEPQDLLPDLQQQSSDYKTSMHVSKSAIAYESGAVSEVLWPIGDSKSAANAGGSHGEQAPHPSDESLHNRHQEEAAQSAALAHAPQPAVVGRYEAAGTNYAMYSDGSVEAENEHGVFRFASMSELRAFIEEGQQSAKSEPAAI